MTNGGIGGAGNEVWVGLDGFSEWPLSSGKRTLAVLVKSKTQAKLECISRTNDGLERE